MSFVSSKGNILCRLIKIELYKIFAIINRAIKGLHCIAHITTHFMDQGSMCLLANTVQETCLTKTQYRIKQTTHTHTKHKATQLKSTLNQLLHLILMQISTWRPLLVFRIMYTYIYIYIYIYIYLVSRPGFHIFTYISYNHTNHENVGKDTYTCTYPYSDISIIRFAI